MLAETVFSDSSFQPSSPQWCLADIRDLPVLGVDAMTYGCCWLTSLAVRKLWSIPDNKQTNKQKSPRVIRNTPLRGKSETNLTSCDRFRLVFRNAPSQKKIRTALAAYNLRSIPKSQNKKTKKSPLRGKSETTSQAADQVWSISAGIQKHPSLKKIRSVLAVYNSPVYP